ncbi:helix-turn-helix domain-containing protein [Nocardia altamirensis]|uniref:helix-turn-helix domain-containing protein n=1 Tax=Nocardia altamirensis TaxID=472158 RepID=UPI00083FDB59|nr:helix-turn-helix domain-containing protein [Nocardia altamirensis]
MATTDVVRFGRLVTARRRELGLTSQQVRDAGGPGLVTLGKIESGTAGKLHLETFAKLDHALQWQPGGATAAYDSGAVPIPLSAEVPAHTSDVLTVPPPNVHYVAFPPGVIDEVVGLAKRLEALAADDARLAEVSEGLDEVADRILRAWTIAEIERMRVAGTLTTSMIEMLLGHYWRRTPQAPNPQDQEELMYMRWLLDRAPETTSPEQVSRFAARWAAVQRMLANLPAPDRG